MNEPPTDCIALVKTLIRQSGSGVALAQRLSINSAHISAALVHGKITPTMRRALIAADLLEYQPRRRFACDLTDERERRIDAIRQRVAHTEGNGALLDYLLDMEDFVQWVT